MYLKITQHTHLEITLTFIPFMCMYLHLCPFQIDCIMLCPKTTTQIAETAERPSHTQTKSHTCCAFSPINTKIRRVHVYTYQARNNLQHYLCFWCNDCPAINSKSFTLTAQNTHSLFLPIAKCFFAKRRINISSTHTNVNPIFQFLTMWPVWIIDQLHRPTQINILF